MTLGFDSTAWTDFVEALSVWMLTFLDLGGAGGPWTSHRVGNLDCSLAWRRRGSGGNGREVGRGEEVEIFNK